jgi:beta-galactosidase
VNNIGPQTKFPVPEGILNYNGSNYIALSLWSLDKEGSKLESLSLEYDTVVKSGYSKPGIVSASKYHKRKGAY